VGSGVGKHLALQIALTLQNTLCIWEESQKQIKMRADAFLVAKPVLFLRN
jgi:predicted ATP-dependent serine protease